MRNNFDSWTVSWSYRKLKSWNWIICWSRDQKRDQWSHWTLERSGIFGWICSCSTAYRSVFSLALPSDFGRFSSDRTIMGTSKSWYKSTSWSSLSKIVWFSSVISDFISAGSERCSWSPSHSRKSFFDTNQSTSSSKHQIMCSRRRPNHYQNFWKVGGTSWNLRRRYGI